jgi:murein DD-endopeptidase MepM/ murein hydrolase activator NlpD
MAMLPGEVEKTGNDSRAGKYVVLRHGNIRVSYCHLSKILVAQGRNVLAGDVIGVTGSTGRSSGEHLHLVTKQNGRVFNPTIMLDFIRETTQLHSNIPKR